MKTNGTITCPEHGKFTVAVDNEPSYELSYVISPSALQSAKLYTSKCPKCGRRLVVKFK